MHVELRFKSMGARLTITDLRARTGLASSALRFYERKGLLRPVGMAGGKRVYDEDAVEKVALIDLLKLAGLTLTEIAALVDLGGKAALDWREQLRAKLRDLEHRIDEMRVAKMIVEHMVNCPHENFDDCPVHREAVRTRAATLGAARLTGSPS